MKKVLTSILFITGSTMIVSAQVLNARGTLFGVPISVSGVNLSGTPQGQVTGGPLLQLLALAQTIVSRLVPFMIGLAILAFFWFLIKFIWKGDESPDERTKGLKGMGYSVIALFVMVSIWGIIALVGNILGVGVGGALPPLEMPKAK